jgi:hypothetical protein
MRTRRHAEGTVTCGVLFGFARMASDQRHVEVVVRLRPGADSRVVAERLAGFGLEVIPLAAGLLATGDASAMMAAFATETLDALPVPDDLREHVASAAVAKPKRFLDGQA